MIYRTLRAKGKVVRGLGEGGHYVAMYSSSFQRALGYAPFPGTLNILLPAPLDLSTCRGTLVEPPLDGYREVYAYLARIGGLSVHVIRPLANKHGDKVLEVISPFNIRERLRLRDGDDVEIEIECIENQIKLEASSAKYFSMGNSASTADNITLSNAGS